jgi:hypothetical protein
MKKKGNRGEKETGQRTKELERGIGKSYVIVLQERIVSR